MVEKPTSLSWRAHLGSARQDAFGFVLGLPDPLCAGVAVDLIPWLICCQIFSRVSAGLESLGRLWFGTKLVDTAFDCVDNVTTWKFVMGRET